jgi:hypothetical protein
VSEAALLRLASTSSSSGNWGGAMPKCWKIEAGNEYFLRFSNLLQHFIPRLILKETYGW